MILIRFLVIVFNVLAIGFLLNQVLILIKSDTSKNLKTLLIFGAVILLAVPILMIMRFIPPTMVFFIVYPLGVALYLYLLREVK